MVTVSVPCQALCRITQAGRTLLYVGDKRKIKMNFMILNRKEFLETELFNETTF